MSTLQEVIDRNERLMEEIEFLQDIKEDYIQLQGRYAQLQETLNKNADTAHKAEEAVSQHEALEAEIAGLKAQVAEHQTAHGATRAQLDDEKAKHERTSALHQEAAGREIALRQQINDLIQVAKDGSSASKILEKHLSEAEGLRTHLQELEAAHMSSSQNASAEHTKLTDLMTELESVRAQLAAKTQECDTKVDSTVVSELQAKADAQTAQLTALKEELDQRDAELGALRESVAGHASKSRGLEDTFGSLQTQHEALQRSHDEAVQRVCASEQSLEEVRAQLAAAIQQHDESERRCHAAVAAADALRVEQSENESQAVGSLRTELEGTAAQLDKLKAHLVSVTAEKETFSRRATELEAEVAELRRCVASRQDATKDHEVRAESMQEMVAQLKAELERITAEKTIAVAKFEECQKRLNNVCEATHQAERENSAYRRALSDEKQRSLDVSNGKNKLENLLQNAQLSHDDVRDFVWELLDMIEAQGRELENCESRNVVEKMKHEEDARGLNTMINDQQSVIRAMELRMKELEEANKTMSFRMFRQQDGTAGTVDVPTSARPRRVSQGPSQSPGSQPRDASPGTANPPLAAPLPAATNPAAGPPPPSLYADPMARLIAVGQQQPSPAAAVDPAPQPRSMIQPQPADGGAGPMPTGHIQPQWPQRERSSPPAPAIPASAVSALQNQNQNQQRYGQPTYSQPSAPPAGYGQGYGQPTAPPPPPPPSPPAPPQQPPTANTPPPEYRQSRDLFMTKKECSLCTLHNPPEATRCEACGNPL